LPKYVGNRGVVKCGLTDSGEDVASAFTRYPKLTSHAGGGRPVLSEVAFDNDARIRQANAFLPGDAMNVVEDAGGQCEMQHAAA
jgi:hypothetical protein